LKFDLQIANLAQIEALISGNISKRRKL